MTSIAISVYYIGSDFSNGRYYAGAARIAVTSLALSANLIPVAGPFISAGIGVFDAVYGQRFYDTLEQTFGN